MPDTAGAGQATNSAGVGPLPSNAAAPSAQTRGRAEGEPAPSLRVPFTQLVFAGTPINLALLTAIAAIPLLVALWLLLFGRTFMEAMRRRDDGLRLAVAGELGVASSELRSLRPKALSKLDEQVTFDELTGTLRRAAGIAAVEREIARARRLKEELTVAFVDVDGLEGINDARGRAAGDAVLKGLAGLVREGLRDQDLVFRFGGDEFVCVLPETGMELAQETLQGLQVEARKTGMAFSFGTAHLEPGDDTVSLLGRADGHLYQAKQGTNGAGALPLFPTRPTVLS